MSTGTGKATIPGSQTTGSPAETVHQDYTVGAAHTMDAFKPSSYTGKQTTTDAGVTFAIATGARRVMFQSLETTGVEEYAVIAFGTSAANAIVNLAVATVAQAGIIIPSGDSTVGGTMGTPILVGIPENAWGENGGYCALGSGLTGQAQVIMATQGV